MYFEIVGPITDIETIAVGRAIRQLSRLRRRHGGGRWRHLKGIATRRIVSGELRRAENHRYLEHGIGRVHHKIEGVLGRAMATRENGYALCVENRRGEDRD